jgi:hypothetical protein
MTDLENQKRDSDLAAVVRLGLFVNQNGAFRSSPRFSECLLANCKMRSDLGDEEGLYAVTLSLRDFSPELNKSDFILGRRLTTRYLTGLRERWREHHKDEVPRSAEERRKAVEELRGRWVSGIRPEQEQDMLTQLYEMQLRNAKEIIGKGGNFQPELLMYRGQDLAVALIHGEDPMSQAIAGITKSGPEGYSFAAEAWRGKPKEGHKWGDIAKSESKVEAFVQVCAENRGPCLLRSFTIDRTRATLIPDAEGSRSRMPRVWTTGASPKQTENAPYGPYM